MQRLFKRQLAKATGASGEVDIAMLAELVVAAYEEADRDRRRTERSIGLMTDELQRANDRLIEGQQIQLQDLQAFAIIGDLASAVAHSLRNPMAAIRTSAELWRSELSTEATDIVDDIIHEIDRMDEYVRDLFAYAGADKSQMRSVDPMVAIDSVMTKRDAALRRNNIVVRRTDRRPQRSDVLVDPLLFEHALTSVVTNAIEAMLDGGTLDVEVLNEAGDDVTILIADNGSGIAPEFIDHVVDSYFTTKANGLGLGLTLARRLIERFSGSLIISSVKGQGTIVSITLKKVDATSAVLHRRERDGARLSREAMADFGQ
jgi:two-component system sensor histidine kinase HydH